MLAGKSFESDDYKSAGIRMGEAVLEQETSDVNGLPILTAGPWARGNPRAPPEGSAVRSGDGR